MHREKKIPLFVRLPEDLVKRFRNYVNQKYSTDRYGWQAYEVEVALKRLLAFENTQLHSTQIFNTELDPIFRTKNKLEKKIDTINRYIMETHGYMSPPTQVPEAHLDEALGIDSRTQKKWKKLLMEHGKIKRIGLRQFEILRD